MLGSAATFLGSENSLTAPNVLDFTEEKEAVSDWEREINKWENQQLTRPIVDLLKAGQRQQAKLALAKYLTQYPDNMIAMEFAGTLLMEDKNYSAAIEAFVRVLDRYPGNNNVRTKLGISLVLLGEHQKGEKILNQVLSLTPGNRLALTYLSWLAQKKGDVQQAQHYLQELVHLSDPNILGKFHLALARLLFQERKYADVVDLLNGSALKTTNSLDSFAANILSANAYIYLGKIAEAEKKVHLLDKKFSDEVNVQFLHGLLARDKKDYSKSIAIYENIIKKTPVRANDAKLEIAKNYSIMNKPEEAVAVLEDLVSSTKTELVPFLVRDMIASLTTAKHYDKALELIEKYSNKFNGLPEISYLKAEIFVLQEKNAEALEYLESLVKKYPDYLQNYILASRIALNKSPIDAEKFLKLAVKNNPNNSSAWIELANLYVQSDALANAEKVMSDAVHQNEADLVLLFELATIKDELGKKQEANDLYRKIIAVNSTHTAALHNLLSNLADQKDGHKEALVIGEFAFSKGLSNPLILDAYSNVLMESGNPKKALDVLNKAVQNITQDLLEKDKVGIAILYFHLGKAMGMNNDFTGAKIYFDKALGMGIDDKYKQQIKKYLSKNGELGIGA